MPSPSHSIANNSVAGPDFDVDLAKFTPRQMEAVKLLDSGIIKFLLYGGALGGGKSYLLRWYGIRRLILLYKQFNIQGAVGMLACEDYPSLKDRQLSKMSREMPAWLGRLHQDHKDYGRCFQLKKRWGGGPGFSEETLKIQPLDDESYSAKYPSRWVIRQSLPLIRTSMLRNSPSGV